MQKRELLEGERVLQKTRPHPLAFSSLYVLWAYLIAVALVFIFVLSTMEAETYSIPLFMDSSLVVQTTPWVYYVFFMLLVLLPSLESRQLSLYSLYVLVLYATSRLVSTPLKHLLAPVPAVSETPGFADLTLLEVLAFIEGVLAKLPLLPEIPLSKLPELVSDVQVTTEPALPGIAISFVPDQQFIVMVWLLLILIPGAIMALTMINWRWFGLFVAVLVSVTVLKIQYGLTFEQTNLFIIAFGILGALGTEYWRRRHRYYLTNLRIVTEVLGHRREVFYNKIAELIFEGSFLGWIFNFGTVIPLTGSGIGTGTDFSFVGGGMAKSLTGKVFGVLFGGRKSVATPRGRSPYILYGIPNPKREYKRITGLMIDRSEDKIFKGTGVKKTPNSPLKSAKGLHGYSRRRNSEQGYESARS